MSGDIFGDISPIVFLRLRRKARRGRVAYVGMDGWARYVSGRRVVRREVSALGDSVENSFHYVGPISEAAIRIYFEENMPDAALFDMGLGKILEGDRNFFWHPVRMPVLTPISEEERKVRWKAFVDAVRPGDRFLSIDTSSLISRLISRVDGGPWSHVGMVLRDHVILEAVTSGTRAGTLGDYDRPGIRIAIYRDMTRTFDIGVNAANVLRLEDVALSMLGRKYALRKAILAGLFRLLGLQGAGLPNDICREADNVLVTYV